MKRGRELMSGIILLLTKHKEENADEKGELPGWAPAFQFLWEDEDVRQEVLRLYCPPLESLEYLPKVRDILEDAIAWRYFCSSRITGLISGMANFK